MDKYLVTPEQAREALDNYGEKYDRVIYEKERRKITGICRTYSYYLEKEGKYPARRMYGKKCGWLLSELLYWIRNQPMADLRAA